MKTLKELLRHPDLSIFKESLIERFSEKHKECLEVRNYSASNATKIAIESLIKLEDKDKWRIKGEVFSFGSYDTVIKMFNVMFENEQEFKLKNAKSIDDFIKEYFTALAEIAKDPQQYSAFNSLIREMLSSSHIARIFPYFIESFPEELNMCIQEVTKQTNTHQTVPMYIKALDFFFDENYIKSEEILKGQKLHQSLAWLIENHSISNKLTQLLIDTTSPFDFSNTLSRMLSSKLSAYSVNTLNTIVDALTHTKEQQLETLLTSENMKALMQLTTKYDAKISFQKIQELNKKYNASEIDELDAEIEQLTELYNKQHLTVQELKEFKSQAKHLKTLNIPIEANTNSTLTAFKYAMKMNQSKDVLKYLFDEFEYQTISSNGIMYFIKSQFNEDRFSFNKDTTESKASIQTMKNALECITTFNSEDLKVYCESISDISEDTKKIEFIESTLPLILDKYTKTTFTDFRSSRSLNSCLEKYKDKLIENNIFIDSFETIYNFEDWLKIRKNLEISEHVKHQLFERVLISELKSIDDYSNKLEQLKKLSTVDVANAIAYITCVEKDFSKIIEQLQKFVDLQSWSTYNNYNVFHVLNQNSSSSEYLSNDQKFDASYISLILEKDLDSKSALEDYAERFSNFPYAAINSIIENNYNTKQCINALKNIVIKYKGLKPSTFEQSEIAAQCLDSVIDFIKSHSLAKDFERFVRDLEVSFNKMTDIESVYISKDLCDVYSKYLNKDSIQLKKDLYSTFQLSVAFQFSDELVDERIARRLHSVIDKYKRSLSSAGDLKFEIDNLYKLLDDRLNIEKFQSVGCAETMSELNKAIQAHAEKSQKEQDLDMLKKIERCQAALNTFITVSEHEALAKKKKSSLNI